MIRTNMSLVMCSYFYLLAYYYRKIDNVRVNVFWVWDQKESNGNSGPNLCTFEVMIKVQKCSIYQKWHES